jgi:cytochrome c oxidase subunit 2
MNVLQRLTLGTALAAAVLTLGSAAPAAARDDASLRGGPKVIAIHAKRFEFEPKEIHLVKGEPVTLALTSEDVTHGFFSRQLHFDEDLAPGKTVSIPLSPTEPGTYTVICDHYCGSGHGGMKMVIVVD